MMDRDKKFKNRTSMIAYFISVLSGKKVKDCIYQARQHKDKPFKVRWSLD